MSYEPVVQVFVTNPNQIIYTDTPDQSAGENPGQLIVRPGPAVITTRPTRPEVSFIYQAPPSGEGVTSIR